MRSSLFGQFLLERNVIDAEQLREGLEYQSGHNRLIGKLAEEKGFITPEDVRHVIERQWQEDKEFGRVAVEMGILSEAQLEELLRDQGSMHVPLGEALIRLGALDRMQLKRALRDYSDNREAAASINVEGPCNFLENPALCFFNVLSRALPRLTGGRFIPGGFYPTISVGQSDVAFSQRVHGALEFEVLMLMEQSLFERLGRSVLSGGGDKPIKRLGRIQLERAVKKVLNIAARHVIRQQVALGVILSTNAEPRKTDADVFRSRRERAESVHCVEVILISPPEPSGDFLQFNLCLLVKK